MGDPSPANNAKNYEDKKKITRLIRNRRSAHLSRQKIIMLRKKVEKKKSEVKTKKVPSISFFGVLLFLMFFGGFVSFLNGRYQGESNQQNTNEGADAFIYVDSGTAPLAASLYVPRNATLGKIYGNLIIVYVLASEKVMTSHGEVLIRKNGEAGIAKYFSHF
ncbi:bZIP transcription factor 17-like [Solanum pennellii]|uniref:BZIP transcription factor 17-like n=1 Tax=Solanum pennellii TaxID=28526 RepID=A0ABM1V6L2_SOLPN|nr:bZIP transcription factor 17-like [Solanum pennellii]